MGWVRSGWGEKVSLSHLRLHTDTCIPLTLNPNPTADPERARALQGEFQQLQERASLFGVAALIWHRNSYFGSAALALALAS